MEGNHWEKQKEIFKSNLEKTNNAISGWEPDEVLDTKKKILDATGPIVVTSSNVISPLGYNTEEHDKNFINGVSAKIVTKYLKNGETFESKKDLEKYQEHHDEIMTGVSDVMNGYINTLKTEKDKSEVKKLFETLSRKDNNTVHEVAFMEIDVNKELEESINNIDKNIRKRIFDDILLGSLGLITAKRTIDDSGLSEAQISKTPVIFGTGGLVNGKMGEYAIKNKINTLRRGNHVSPTMISTAPSGIVVHNGMHEGHNTFSNACASYLSGVFGGIEKIKGGDSRILISSADTISYNVSVISFKALGALGTGLTCPFDKRANGFMPSEGAYSMLLEKEAEALARGKKPIMQIAGYAESSDATIRITDPEINRQAEAMLKALHMAGIQPEDIDGVVTHGTSTQAGDPSEATAIHAVFGNHKPTIMAPKSSCGHNIGTASALGIQCAETAFKYGIGPAILNLEDPIPAAEGLELATGKKRKFKYIMVNSFGFGGYNACLILKKYEQKK